MIKGVCILTNNIHKDTTLDSLCILISNSYTVRLMATRQNSTNGKPKSPRIQVVLPELICEQLTNMAENESRTVSNMAKVLIQEGIKNYFEKKTKSHITDTKINTENFIDTLERQSIKRLKGAPQRIIYSKKSDKNH